MPGLAVPAGAGLFAAFPPAPPRIGRAAARVVLRFPRLGAPRGGGTLVLAGLHRLVAPYLGLGEAFRLDRVRTSLAAHPWLRALWKLGGDRNGDRMHSDRLHAAAPNRPAGPRMTLIAMAAPDRSQQPPRSPADGHGS
jgi:hypothetical protein